MTSEVVRLDRLEAGLVAWARQGLPTATVLWAPSEFPQPSAGDLVVEIKTLGAPAGSGASTVIRSLPTSVTIRIGTPVVGEAVRIAAAGRGYEREFTGSDTAESARDALLALIDADDLISFTASADSTDGIVLAPAEAGDLYDVRVRGTAPSLISEESRTTSVVECQIEDVTTTVSVEAWSLDRYPATGAVAALSRLIGTARLQASRRILRAYGLTLAPISRPNDTSQLSGPKWSSRAAFTAQAGQVSLAAAGAETITRVRGTMTGRNPDGTAGTAAIDTE